MTRETTLTYRQVGGARTKMTPCTTIRVSRHPPPKLEGNPRFFVLDYRDVMKQIRICLLGKLWTNQVETNRLSAHIKTSAFSGRFNIPDDLLRELMWPSHIPLPSLENSTDDEPDAGEAISSLVKVPFPLRDHFPNYTYDPRHMLCLSCHESVLERKFWSWWEVQRRLPPVDAPDQPGCWRGIDCESQGDTDHASMYNVSGLLDELRSPALSSYHIDGPFQHWCPNAIQTYLEHWNPGSLNP